jgi:hypothetical protein
VNALAYSRRMIREGSIEDWTTFHLLIGKYAVAASSCESWMYRILIHLEQDAGLVRRHKAPNWKRLVVLLRAVVVGGPHEERLQDVLRAADRHADVRNNFVHTSWFAASRNRYIGRRHFGFGEGGSAMMFLSRSVLEESLRTMEGFESQLELFAVDFLSGKR